SLESIDSTVTSHWLSQGEEGSSSREKELDIDELDRALEEEVGDEEDEGDDLQNVDLSTFGVV
ncbi:unnamed protein product, partial [Linum tenue]